jgi:hypothetical protein
MFSIFDRFDLFRIIRDEDPDTQFSRVKKLSDYIGFYLRFIFLVVISGVLEKKLHTGELFERITTALAYCFFITLYLYFGLLIVIYTQAFLGEVIMKTTHKDSSKKQKGIAIFAIFLLVVFMIGLQSGIRRAVHDIAVTGT